jgi:hypothetical protein
MHHSSKVLTILLSLFLSLSCGIAQADWVPDDDGSLHFWNPPKPLTIKPQNSTAPSAAEMVDAEVLFIMDTSGSMNDEFSALCSRIPDIVQGLMDNNINIKYQIYGINSTRDCATTRFSNAVASTTINHEEDWGPAAYDAAIPGNYPWNSGYRKILVLMSDEGADDGDYWTAADDAAIDTAIVACQENGVGVVPIIGSSWDSSQESLILAGAGRLANSCWGDVYRSVDPNATLVQAILNAINNVIYKPTSDKISTQIHVDDALGAQTSINKIRGDIAFLVAQVTNGTGSSTTGNLSIEFPANWTLAATNPVVKRASDGADEVPLDPGAFISTPGKVEINGITIPIGWTAEQYVAKVIIPKDENANQTVLVKARISPVAGQSNFIAVVDQFGVNILSQADTMIVTNRNLLYKNYSDDPGSITAMLNTLQEIAKLRNGLVFYADWWDEYDINISKVNPDGLPIKEWDRDNLNYSSQSEAQLNTTVTAIDKYTHYWGEQLKGSNWKKNDSYLLLVGGDREIPFYRIHIPGADQDDCFFERPSKHDGNTHHGVTTHLKKAAKKDYMITDDIFRTTDNDFLGWRGDVDLMYVGRVSAQDAANMKTFVTNIKRSMNWKRHGNSAVVSNGTDWSNFWEHPITDKDMLTKLLNKEAKEMKSICEFVNYDVVNKVGDTTLMPETRWTSMWNEEDINLALTPNTDYWYYFGHGNNAKFGGDKIAYLPVQNLIMAACSMGIADWDINEANKNIFIYSAVRKNAASIIAATSITDAYYDDPFADELVRKSTGYSINSCIAPFSIGKALNKAKQYAKTKSTSGQSRIAFLLYGAPWKVKVPPAKSESPLFLKTITQTVFKAESISSPVSQPKAMFTRSIEEIISQYQIGEIAGFDQLEIKGFDQYMGGSSTTPVVPVKTIRVVVPGDATVSDVRLNRNNATSLGSLDLPIFHGFVLQTAPDSIGLFNTTHRWFEIDEGQYKTIIIDIFPVAYDAVTDLATLYQNLTLEVQYDTEAKGVLTAAGPTNVNYSLGEVINVSAFVSNVTGQAQNYTLTAELISPLDSTVMDSDTQVLNIPAADEGEETLALTAPLTGGGCWVKVTANDSEGNSIGDVTEHINVSAGQIAGLTISKAVPGEPATFEVTFVNQSAQGIDARFGMTIYQGTKQIADFVPVSYMMAAGTEQAALFTWNVPEDFPGGQYLAVATVHAGDDIISVSENFGIGQFLREGWNLISLSEMPTSTDIDKVLEPIMDSVISVWGYKNGTWKIYLPSDPALSDLSTMEAGFGYWVNTKSPAYFVCNGNPAPQNNALIKGWNLAGYNSTEVQPISKAMSTIDKKFLSVWAFIDGAWKVYDSENPGFSDLDQMTPGLGYWINTTEACSWVLP